MRIGVISDTHIADRTVDLPSAISKAFKGLDMIIHAGDLADESVLDKLEALSTNVKAVFGNMDPKSVRKRLPEKVILKVGKFKIGLMHGRGAPKGLIDLLTDAFKKDKVDMIIFGHSHSAFNEKKGDILFFNPGSATDTVFAPYRSYGIIDVKDEIKAKIVKL